MAVYTVRTLCEFGRDAYKFGINSRIKAQFPQKAGLAYLPLGVFYHLLNKAGLLVQWIIGGNSRTGFCPAFAGMGGITGNNSKQKGESNNIYGMFGMHSGTIDRVVQADKQFVKALDDSIEEIGRYLGFTRKTVFTVKQFKAIFKKLCKERAEYKGIEPKKVLHELERKLFIEKAEGGRNKYQFYKEKSKIDAASNRIGDRVKGGKNIEIISREIGEALCEIWETSSIYALSKNPETGITEMTLIGMYKEGEEKSPFFNVWKEPGGIYKEALNMAREKKGFVCNWDLKDELEKIKQGRHSCCDKGEIEKDFGIFDLPQEGNPGKISTIVVRDGQEEPLLIISVSNRIFKKNKPTKGSSKNSHLSYRPCFSQTYDKEPRYKRNINEILLRIFDPVVSLLQEKANEKSIREIINEERKDQKETLLALKTDTPEGDAVNLMGPKIFYKKLKSHFEVGGKTFFSKDQEGKYQKVKTKIISIKNPHKNIPEYLVPDFRRILREISRQAWKGKTAGEVKGYSDEYIDEHFKTVDELKIVFRANTYEPIAFAGIKKKTAGEKEYVLMEVTMVKDNCQRYGIGSYLNRRLNIAMLKAKKMKPFIFAFRTANPLVYGAYANVIGSANRDFYPTRDKNAGDNFSQIAQDVAGYLSPGYNFNPETFVIDSVYPKDSGLIYDPQKVPFYNEEINDFCESLLHYSRAEGNAMVFVGELSSEVVRTHFSRSRHPLWGRIYMWYLEHRYS